jgi:5-methylcytosine-specific restriction endonuclease McrA
MNSKYNNYIRSEKWKNFKKSAIVNAGRKCQCCGVKNVLLEVHHVHYRTLGNESLSDVKVVCVSCHRREDRSREIESGLDTYATKKYGNEWYQRDKESIEKEFDDWLEKKDREYRGY